MLKFTAIALAFLIFGVLLAAATRPDTFRVQRSRNIKAPPERIFPLINDLHRFNTWNPFEKKDPNLKGRYSGAEAGAGAAYAFDGNQDVGSGRLEIIESRPASEVQMKLDMIAPIEAHNDVRFTLEPRGDATVVTWTMYGHVPFFARILHLFMDMDRMVGTEFENGLASLKLIAEK